MSQGNQSCLRFSLEESVWFQKGQEVAELVSISLDPNITVQENDQYVAIRGSLELTGEYTRQVISATEEQDSYTSAKFVHSIMEREDGGAEFLHQFPVDITIPNNRIASINDIDITVESFDYLLPERGCLRLTADLAITGLYGEQQHGSQSEEVDIAQLQEINEPELVYREGQTAEALPESVQKEDADEIAEDTSTNWSAYNDPDHVAEKRPDHQLYTPFEAEAKKVSENPEQETVLAEAEETVLAEAEQAELAEHQEEAPVGPEISFAAQRSENIPAPIDLNNQASPDIADLPDAQVPEEYDHKEDVQVESEVESSSSDEPAPKKKKKGSKKKGLSLTEFFARKEEPEVAKLRVCIVQQGDTVEQIANRYEIQVNQLLRVNQLDIDQDVHEGQVLYVPGKAASLY
ncbi:stage VI sporulation protein D [Mesobacillus harenae]|uniref:stage VI sporulation protein D n=1 Tax=Mesobacillus harenae TaxID=2213203 RepID=UPI0015808902|nr:stage VI sporulation protein D [Mesobacillus harenae]